MKEKNEFLDVKGNIDNLMEKLEKFIQSKTVIGEPIQIGETTLVPLVSASFGLGSGGGDGSNPKGENGIGGGAGIAAKISPLAVLVIKNGKTEMLTLKNTQALEKLIDQVPEILSKVKEHSEEVKLSKTE